MFITTILFFGIVFILIIHFFIKQYLIGKNKIIRNLKVPKLKKNPRKNINKKKINKKVTFIEPNNDKIQMKKNLKKYIDNYNFEVKKHKEDKLSEINKFFEIQNNDVYLIPKNNIEIMNSSANDIQPFECDDMLYSSFARY